MLLIYSDYSNGTDKRWSSTDDTPSPPLSCAPLEDLSNWIIFHWPKRAFSHFPQIIYGLKSVASQSAALTGWPSWGTIRDNNIIIQPSSIHRHWHWNPIARTGKTRDTVSHWVRRAGDETTPTTTRCKSGVVCVYRCPKSVAPHWPPSASISVVAAWWNFSYGKRVNHQPLMVIMEEWLWAQWNEFFSSIHYVDRFAC